VTSFASSRLASVTRDIRENFREFGGLWRVTRELNEMLQYIQFQVQ
jgi:hypothetical protein